jgi:hypothetical protein
MARMDIISYFWMSCLSPSLLDVLDGDIWNCLFPQCSTYPAEKLDYSENVTLLVITSRFIVSVKRLYGLNYVLREV